MLKVFARIIPSKNSQTTLLGDIAKRGRKGKEILGNFYAFRPLHALKLYLRPLRYRSHCMAATAPSAQAVTTWRSGVTRTSPAA